MLARIMVFFYAVLFGTIFIGVLLDLCDSADDKAKAEPNNIVVVNAEIDYCVSVVDAHITTGKAILSGQNNNINDEIQRINNDIQNNMRTSIEEIESLNLSGKTYVRCSKIKEKIETEVQQLIIYRSALLKTPNDNTELQQAISLMEETKKDLLSLKMTSNDISGEQ